MTWLLIAAPACPMKKKKTYFSAYHRGKNAGKDSPGEGLGLYIVKSNIEKLGGKITVEDSLQGGACFSVMLPKEGLNI